MLCLDDAGLVLLVSVVFSLGRFMLFDSSAVKLV